MRFGKVKLCWRSRRMMHTGFSARQHGERKVSQSFSFMQNSAKAATARQFLQHRVSFLFQPKRMFAANEKIIAS
jgi:hypothetical protein